MAQRKAKDAEEKDRGRKRGRPAREMHISRVSQMRKPRWREVKELVQNRIPWLLSDRFKVQTQVVTPPAKPLYPPAFPNRNSVRSDGGRTKRWTV